MAEADPRDYTDLVNTDLCDYNELATGKRDQACQCDKESGIPPPVARVRPFSVGGVEIHIPDVGDWALTVEGLHLGARVPVNNYSLGRGVFSPPSRPSGRGTVPRGSFGRGQVFGPRPAMGRAAIMDYHASQSNSVGFGAPLGSRPARGRAATLAFYNSQPYTMDSFPGANPTH